ncbi:hypothetical protein ACLOJK_009478 [Asimina triloba]
MLKNLLIDATLGHLSEGHPQDPMTHRGQGRHRFNIILRCEFSISRGLLLDALSRTLCGDFGKPLIAVVRCLPLSPDGRPHPRNWHETQKVALDV